MDKRQQYYVAILKITETRGWSLLMEDIETQIKYAKDNCMAAGDLRELGFLQGRVSAFAEMLALESTLKSALDSLLEDEADANL
jgi:hypothetical protein